MSATTGPVEPERNFLFARTPKIPVGARPRRCADNTNAAVAWSHRLCPFASSSLARARARTATRLSPCHGDGCPARTDRARRHSSPISSSLDIARRATIDQAGPRKSRASRRRRGPWRRRRVADLRVAIDPPGRFRRRARQSRGSDAAVASPDRTRGRNLPDRAVSRSRRRCYWCPRRAPWAHPRSLSLPLPTDRRYDSHSARSHFPLRRRTRASPYPPARLLVPTPPVALFVVKLFMLYILKGTYQPPFP